MEVSISRLFCDDTDNIYVVDNAGVLYNWYKNKEFMPFTSIMKNIKKCFAVDDYYYVYNDSCLSIFNEHYDMIDADEYPRHLISVNNLDDVLYCPKAKILITVEKKKILLYNLNEDTKFDIVKSYQPFLSSIFKNTPDLNKCSKICFDEVKLVPPHYLFVGKIIMYLSLVMLMVLIF